MDVRSSYNCFPGCTQFFWTWLTGKPNEDEQPFFATNCWGYLAGSVLIFLVGVSISMTVMLQYADYLWLALSIPLTVLGSRLIVLTIAHQCAHNMFCENKELNRVVHDFISTAMLSQDYKNYRHDHLAMHHGIKTFGSFYDPVLDFIRATGLKEGLTKRQLWIRMWLMFLSPQFHGRYLFNRLKSNFFKAERHRIAMSCLWWAALMALVWRYPNLLMPILVAYVFPIVVLYHISAFLELICEHIWMRPIAPGHSTTGKTKIAALSWARFCGDPVPEGRDVMRWLVWIGRLVVYHLPSRVLVLTGDAPQHDYHHVNPRSRHWTMSAYDRRDGVVSGKCDHIEVWGLLTAIDMVFEQISSVRDVGDLPEDLVYLHEDN